MEERQQQQQKQQSAAATSTHPAHSYEQQIAALQAKLREVEEAGMRYQIHKEQQQHEELQKALEVQERTLRKELEQTFAKELAQERHRCQKAVEAEQHKMRKLVKALAIRETKLLKQAHKERKQMGRGVDESTAIMAAASSSTATAKQHEPKSTPTTRGFR